MLKNPTIVSKFENWFYLAKEAQAGCNWDYGFRADAVYGVDAQFFQAFGNPGPSGFDNGWDYGSYGWAMPQLYAEIANCNWRFKAGRFLSPIGYESIPSIDNFFYSRTFLRTYTEPYTMTGILGERTINDRLSLLVGGSLGWDTAFDRNNGGFNLITGVRYRVNCNVRVGFTSSFGDTSSRTDFATTCPACLIVASDFSGVTCDIRISSIVSDPVTC